ncbi:MAG TPA: DUF2934 domain-containing protein [Fimbriimonadaceae bacterium]
MPKSESKAKVEHPEHVQAKINERAYFISQSEGFPHGKEIIHWLKAEEEILKEMLKGVGKAIANVTHKSSTNGSAKTDAQATKPATAKAVVKPAAAKPAAAKAVAAKPAASKPAAAKPAAKKSAAKKTK